MRQCLGFGLAALLAWCGAQASAQQPADAETSKTGVAAAARGPDASAPTIAAKANAAGPQLGRTDVIFDIAVSKAAVLGVGRRGLLVLADPTTTAWRRIEGDRTRAWTAVTDLDDGGFLVAGTAGALLKVSADGATAKTERIGTDSTILALARVGSTLYAAGEFGALFESSDGGRRWEPVDLPWGTYLREAWRELGQTKPHLFGVCASETGSEVFVVGEYGLVLARRDGRWHQLSGGKVQPAIFACTYHRGQLYVAGQRGTLLRTPDQGKSWKDLRFTDVDLYALAPLDQGIAVSGDVGTIAVCALVCVKPELPSPGGWFARMVRVPKGSQRLLVAGSTLIELTLLR